MSPRFLALLLAQAVAARPAPPALSLSPVPGHTALLASGIPPAPRELRQRVQRFLHARGASLLDTTADGGQVLIATRFGATRQMHLVDHPRGDRFQLTFGEEPISSAHFVPGDPSTILFTQDQGGGEAFQIHRFDRRTGRSELLTDGKSRHETLRLSRDGKWVAFSSTARNGTDNDVYLAAVGDIPHARPVVADGGAWHASDFSSDGKKLLVTRHRSIADGRLWVLDLESGKRQPVGEGDGPASLRMARFSHDGKGVFFISDRYSDFNGLYFQSLENAGAKPVPLTGGVRWNVESFAVAGDGSKLAAVINEDGYSRLYIYPLRDGAVGAPRVGPLPQGEVGAISFPAERSDVLTLELHTPRSPLDVFQLELEKNELVRWTRSEVGGLDTDSFVEPQLVRYPSKDGVEVPAFLYRPRAEPGVKRPTIIIWHGGPESQSRPAFAPFVQLLVAELGCAVLLPNVRGSDGYGKAYLAMDDGVKREESLADIGATLDFIARQPDLDASRVGVYGGSYGGYMTLATLAFHPRRVRAGVDVVGISSLPSFLRTTKGYRRDLRRAEYGDERDEAVRVVQERISPLGSASAIEAALFVVQGHNDPRVPRSEAEQIVRAVRSNGRDVWYLLALDEGHGFKKKLNTDYAAVATVLFFREKLLPPVVQQAAPAAVH